MGRLAALIDGALLGDSAGLRRVHALHCRHVGRPRVLGGSSEKPGPARLAEGR